MENSAERTPFDSSPVEEKQREYMTATREEFKKLYFFIKTNVPESREKSIAITKLEEASMWAIKAISFNG